MTTVSIIAGSKSDEKFVEPIQRIFTNNNISFEVQYLSAHRDKNALESYVTQSTADYFIAIAGLAAALPGSIAVDTNKPVIAVPVWSGSSSSPAGLDALLAAVQMPPPKDGKDVAVGCVAINHPEYAAEFIVKSIALRKTHGEFDVAIYDEHLEEPHTDYLKKLTETLDVLGLEHCIGIHTASLAKTLIVLTDTLDYVTEYARTTDAQNELRQIISVPILTENEISVLGCVLEGKAITKRDMSPADDSIAKILYKLYGMAPKGPAVSVGFGNVKNAAYLAKRLLGK